MTRWLLLGCALIACSVPDKVPSSEGPSSMPGEVAEAPYDARTTSVDSQSTPLTDAGSPDAGSPQTACDEDDDCKEPEDRCIDDDYLLRYKDAKCVAGFCVYSHEVKYCEDGCEDDECD